MDGSGSSRSLRLSGLIGVVAALAVVWTISSVVNVPFPPTSVAARIVRAAPGGFATFFIEVLGHWALRLLTAGALVAAAAIGAEAFVVTATRGTPRPALAATLLALAGAGAAFLEPTFQPDPIYVVATMAGAAAVYAAVATSVYRRLGADASEADETRRKTIRLGLAGATALAALGTGAGWILRRLQGPDTNVTLTPPRASAAIPQGRPFPAVPGITPEVTSVSDHYEVDINLLPPTVEAAGWTLTVFGDVDAPAELGFDELQARFEVVEEFATLTCVSNEVGGDLVGHSAWGGVRLADVLDAARPRQRASEVVLRAADGYSDSIPLELALDPQVILAVSQNGRPLTREHGFPCRLRVPPIYGMKNVKWLRSIELRASDYQGYWQRRGWSDEARVKTESRIDVAGDDLEAVVGRPTWVAGVAWAGDRGIERVEVSVDGGRTWELARLREAIGPASWQQWAYRWTPREPGPHIVVCRATDGEGNTQTAQVAAPHPAGASGYHRVTVDVSPSGQ